MLIRQGVLFFRTAVWRLLIISALLLLPCFWHKRIEAGDLPSHTYNAWLSQLIAQGRAPGLYIESRWDNVLSDIALAKLSLVAGFVIAEHVVVALAVLIFFWGAFVLSSAANLRPPWTLVPAIAMIAYGWTFYAGFLNYYLSLGFAFWAVALFWRGCRVDLLAGAMLAFLALLAHPMGLFFLVGFAIYLRLADILHGWLRWLLFIFAFLIVLGFHYYALHLQTAFWHTWKDFVLMNGADQLVLFGTRYQRLALAIVVFGALCFFLRHGARMGKSRFSPGRAGSSRALATLGIDGVNDSRSGISPTFTDAVCVGDRPSNFCHRSFSRVYPRLTETQNLAFRRTRNMCPCIFRLDLSGHGDTERDRAPSGNTRERPALRAACHVHRYSSARLASSHCQPQPGSRLYCKMLRLRQLRTVHSTIPYSRAPR
jgi:hypothetical protein